LLGNKKTNKLFEKVTDINEDFIYKRPNSTWFLGEFGDQLLMYIEDNIYISEKKQFFGCVFSIVQKDIYLERFPKYNWPIITTEMVNRIQYQNMMHRNLITGFNIYTGEFQYLIPKHVFWYDLREEEQLSINLQHLIVNWDKYKVDKDYCDIVDKNLFIKEKILKIEEFHPEWIKINPETE
jgi:hypothetical protein